MLDALWDVIASSAFLRWFLVGALAGLLLSILAWVVGLPIYGEHALLIIAGCGAASVLARLATWLARR